MRRQPQIVFTGVAPKDVALLANCIVEFATKKSQELFPLRKQDLQIKTMVAAFQQIYLANFKMFHDDMDKMLENQRDK